MSVSVLAGCSVSVRGLASPAETTTSAPATASSAPQLPGGAQRPCLTDDNCDDSNGSSLPAAGLVCSPLPAAMTAFDERARAELPGGGLPTPESSAARGALTDLVIGVVEQCGFQVMIDIAYQYPDPLYSWLRSTAVSALGEISALPDGLRCADLDALGLGPKQAIDYWFLSGAPGLMDADLNGIPCETVWPGMARYMPPYW
jgi:hypothetical protein